MTCVSAQAATLRIQVTDTQGRPLPNAAVAVDWDNAPPLARNPPPATMRQQNMTFQPRVLAVPVNTDVSFPNFDNTRHHVYSFSEAKTFDIKLYVGYPERPVHFDEPGLVSVGCNIHDYMRAFIVVRDAPRNAVTDESGEVVFDDVPRVPRDVEIWQEQMDVGSDGVRRSIAADRDVVQLRVPVTRTPPTPSAQSNTLQQRFDRIAQ